MVGDGQKEIMERQEEGEERGEGARRDGGMGGEQRERERERDERKEGAGEECVVSAR